MAMKAPPSIKGVVGQIDTSIDLRGLLSRQHISTTSNIPNPNTAQVMMISLEKANDMNCCLSERSVLHLNTVI